MNGKLIMIVFIAILIVFCLMLVLDIRNSMGLTPERLQTRSACRKTGDRERGDRYRGDRYWGDRNSGDRKPDSNVVAKAKKAMNGRTDTVPAFAPSIYLKAAGTDGYKRYPILKDTTNIGRGADNDIVLSDPAVSERHGVILKLRDRQGVYYVYRNLSRTNPTEYLNKEEEKYEWLSYREPVCLGGEEGFYIGDTQVVIKTPPMGHLAKKEDLYAQKEEPYVHKLANNEAPAEETRQASGRAIRRDDVFKCL